MSFFDSGFSVDSLLFGITLGVLLAAVVYVREIFKRRALNSEIKTLQKHLHTKMEIDAEATTGKNKELENLRKQNENLRVSNKTLQQKPGRAEVINFHIYQKAINYMAEAAPGFAPLWQKALKEAEEEVGNMEEGSTPFIKRIIQIPFSGTKGIDEHNEK